MQTTNLNMEERAEGRTPYSAVEIEEIGDRVATRVAKELEHYYVRARVFFTTLYIDVGTPFAEISEAVAHQLENAYNMNEEFAQEVDMLAEAEILELFEERYEDTLMEINSEHAVYVHGRIETPKYVIEFTPLECSEDYCIAGLTVEITFKERIDDTDIENIAQLIATVFRL
jgi:hypothetical protein